MFDWDRYLLLAERLAQRQGEASKRIAISRAYYCVFHRARRLLEHDGSRISADGWAHEEVWDLMETGDVERCMVARWGRTLRKLRRKADYVDYVPDMAQVTENAMMPTREAMRVLGRGCQ